MSAKKPYCKVCHDAGKEYNNHWVKDLNGNTTCPTLLNTECRYCYKLGHTAKFCDVLTKNKKEKERAERRADYAPKDKPKDSKKPVKNTFDALQEDSDVEEEIKVNIKPNVVVEEYPILGEKSKKIEAPQPEAKIGWAAIAAKPKVDLQEKPKVEEKQVKKTPSISNPKYTKSWADYSESDTEEEDVIDEYDQYYGEDW